MSRFDYILRRKRQSMLNKLTKGGKWLGLNKEILLMQISEELMLFTVIIVDEFEPDVEVIHCM